MYWRQTLLSSLLTVVVGYLLSAQQGNIFVGIGSGVVVYIALSAAIATLFRTRYWLSRGGHRSQSQGCSNCGQYIRRQSGDWILRCKRCGWTAGFPILRWFYHSVPAVQFRRSLGGKRLILLVLGLVLILSAPAMGTLNFDTNLGGSTETSGDESPTENEPSGPTDTDGDGLTNEIESTSNVGGYPLPEADQDHKDLYIRVYVGNGIEPLTHQEKADLRKIWAGMPVSNPDGAEGIDLHIIRL